MERLKPNKKKRDTNIDLNLKNLGSPITWFINVTFIVEQTRVLLTSAAFVYLKNIDFSKHTRNLSPASRTILLSGPAELYQQMLAKALAHYFEAKLLLLDVTDFSLKVRLRVIIIFLPFEFTNPLVLILVRSKANMEVPIRKMRFKGPLQKQPWHECPTYLDQRYLCFKPNKKQQVFNFRCSVHSSHNGQENVVITFVSKSSPMVLYLRDVEKLLCRSQRVYSLFQKMLKKISGPVLIIGSQVVDLEKDYRELDERITSVFPYNIEIKPPQEENHLVSWKSQLEEDMKMIQFQDNRNHISEVLAANDLDCDDLASICVADTIDLSKYIEEIVVSAISYHLTHTKNPEYRNGKLVISTASLSHGLSLFQEGKSVKDTSKVRRKRQPITQLLEFPILIFFFFFFANNYAFVKGVHGSARFRLLKTDVGGPKPETKVESARPSEAEASAPKNTDNVAPATPKAPGVPADNEFEKRIRPEVIPASEIGVTFSDVGSLDDIKESLQELVMLPLRRPDLFIGGLLKPCRGILLFGPPGTGKTMLAKAIANEAGASFINVSMSTITSKWFGEDEKNVRALFSLAAKVSPTIIFVDEVDSMLGQRSRAGEHEAMRKIKNEFMTHWDGLLTKPGERILVLAATNRPFDLDEAIIRRFERRIMVGLPSVENREKILTTLLAKEQIDEGLNLKEVANMTEGYTGSDLKNLCNTAAYRPVRELIQQERLKDMEKKRLAESGVGPESPEENEEEKVIKIRPLNMEDFREAKNQVAASFASEGSIMSELKQWNEQYGEGGSRKKEQLSYFL
ncbi:putative AAA+ ATPase domain, ATPase, AAA-type, core, AAA ATPase, AAA+ lid domain-containing protein [Helianthus annuus]|nr:putative AAA+ ATPase domain, ATPase, AAA-type, core, AAA ATPase, AAA+ lid domain-containing protein [Helianthus annuus]KAJ0739561.1 putative AAA+ ATPase domain, ATPase, AAA-type, core, AAA ATPase, AAA+ lid domain-containing protein [Helianthus annuus]